MKPLFLAADFALLRDALFKHQVIVIRDQLRLSARAQFELTKRFDPAATIGRHGLDLHPVVSQMPHEPFMQIIGNSPAKRRRSGSGGGDDDDDDFTHFYRWHLDPRIGEGDAPPIVTSILALRLPAKRRMQTIRYGDGTGDELSAPLGTCVFASGEAMHELLSEEDRAFVQSTHVAYADEMTRDGLHPTGLSALPVPGCLSFDEEEEEEEGAEEHRRRLLPMCWKNPVTGRLALQVDPSTAMSLHWADGMVIEDVAQVRNILYRLQRPGIAPALLYAHDWREGDLVLFNNRGVLHTLVGTFNEDEIRVLRQVVLAGTDMPEGP